MKWFTDFLKKMDKTKWLVLGLSGILLLVVALPTGQIKETKEDAALQESLSSQQAETVQADSYEKKLTSNLEQVLRCMDGVGDVRVMLTFRDSGENIVEKDIVKSQNEANTQYQESAVLTESEGRQPYISMQKMPAVEGVLVIAQGGGDSNVKQTILDAVLALFPIEAHKVKIVKMQGK